MKKLIPFGAALLALAAVMHHRGTDAQAQAPAAAAASGSKIRLVNIAKVLRNYAKANVMGKEITEIRAVLVQKMTKLRADIETKRAEMVKTATPQAKKEEMERDITAIQRQIQDLDREAQKQLGSMSNDTIVKVYKDIKDVIERIAVANSLELILCYPDASLPAEENTAAVAQLKLQTPAAMPFYHRGLDITDFVIDALNKANPVAAAPTGDGAVQPVGGAPAPMQ